MHWIASVVFSVLTFLASLFGHAPASISTSPEPVDGSHVSTTTSEATSSSLGSFIESTNPISQVSNNSSLSNWLPLSSPAIVGLFTYELRNGQVYFADLDQLLSPQPNLHNFVVSPDLEYGTDGVHVYYHSLVISGADPKTFAPIDYPETQSESLLTATGYARDKSQVYYADRPVLDADPSSFTILTLNGEYDPFYTKDKRGVFCIYPAEGSETIYPVMIPGADASTFSLACTFRDNGGVGPEGGCLVENYGRDKYHVYDNCSILASADPNTFAPILNSSGELTGYMKDVNHVYASQLNTVDMTYRLVEVPGTNPATFQLPP